MFKKFFVYFLSLFDRNPSYFGQTLRLVLYHVKGIPAEQLDNFPRSSLAYVRQHSRAEVHLYFRLGFRHYPLKRADVELLAVFAVTAPFAVCLYPLALAKTGHTPCQREQLAV